MNKVPSDAGEWGEDIFSLATARSIGDEKIALRTEESIRAKYRREMRVQFESNEEVRQLLASTSDPTEVQEKVSAILHGTLRPGTEYLFDQVLKELLLELRTMLQADPSLYLVDESTGKVLIPLRAGAIYQPPPYVADNGEVHKSKPILHPGIAAPLVESRSKKERMDLIMADPSHVYDHIRTPDAIKDKAKLELEKLGVQSMDRQVGEYEVLTFGREYYEGVMQSPNPMFHRVEAFGGTLARQVSRFLQEKKASKCSLGPVSEKQNSKWRWYEVSVYYA